ncbi:MAG: ROK family protein, partial [Gammaproteobacteria bacterium]|nr:ROK family protein [Gammaproteobacteria bacterium]
MNKHTVNKKNNTDKNGWCMGVDVGGTKIECAVIASGNSPDAIVRRRIPTEGNGGYRHVLQRIAGLVMEVGEEAGLRPDVLGVGTPGTLDPDTGLLRGCNSQHLLERPFKADLEALLGIPIVVENDANCLALAETWMGVVPDLPGPKDVVFGVIMGTGVGGGLVVDGNLVTGANRITGEWGLNHLDDS